MVMSENEAITELGRHGIRVSSKYAGARCPYWVDDWERGEWMTTSKMIAYAESGRHTWLRSFDRG